MVTRWVLGPWLNIFWVWTGDLSEYLLVFLTFIGAGIVSREHEHISIDFIVERVSQSAARILLGIQISFIMIFLLILAQGIIPLYLRNQGLQIGTLPVQPPFTSAWLYIAAGAGALIMLAYAIRDAVYLITNPENILPHTNDEENG
jgi:TRAP-type C4-dicarboxylate transport system permease small subunit